MNKNDKFVYLILHFQTINDTRECVKSIINRYNEATIVIVDNGSTNNTGKVLQQEYNNNKNIHVILSEKNLGFANGNNLGIKYIKEKLDYKFIVVMNNDIELIDDEFENKIKQCYEKEKFAVLGPKIILKDNSINPIVKNAESIKQIKEKIRKTRIRQILNYMYLDSIVDILKKDKKSDFINTEECEEIHYNIMLHGCFFVLSNIYLEAFEGLYDKTFLYMEEEFLYYRLKSMKMKSIYYPQISILHKEFSSTKSITKTNRRYKAFRYKNLIKSSKLLYKFLKENGEYNV